MQTISEDLIEKLTNDGLSPKEIQTYCQGLFDGFNSIKISLSNSFREVKENETDPLYIHTWNDAIKTLSDLINEIIENTFSAKE